MRALLSKLILPLPVFWIIIVISLIFFSKKNRKWGFRFLFLDFFLLAVVSTPFVPGYLVDTLENKYQTFDVQNFKKTGSTHILVLGAGHSNDDRLPANNKLSVTSLARLSEGIRLSRELTGSLLITSGFGGKGKIPQAEIFAEAACLLGIDSTRIRMQVLPKNTWMEACEYKRLFADSSQLILVTSAVHIPRSMYLFKKAGLNPVAAPTDHLVKRGKTKNPWFWLPSSENIKKMESVIHEYVGMWWYKMGGE